MILVDDLCILDLLHYTDTLLVLVLGKDSIDAYLAAFVVRAATSTTCLLVLLHPGAAFFHTEFDRPHMLAEKIPMVMHEPHLCERVSAKSCSSVVEDEECELQ